MEPICEGFRPGDGKPCVNSVDSKGDFCDLPSMFRCIEYIRRKEIRLSYSSCRDFTTCKRKFWWSYIAGIEPIDLPLPMMLGRILSDHLDLIHNKYPSTDFPVYDWSQHKKDDDGNMWPQFHALRGLIKGYIEKYGEMKGDTQFHFDWVEDGYPRLHGFIDLKYLKTMDYEFKYTSRQEAYTKFAVQDQLGTYFLGDKEAERITVRAILMPQLRQGKNESPLEYEERVYQDFLARPKFYVKDMNYWREEFNYFELKTKVQMIANDIIRYLELGGIEAFYQSNGPSTCYGDTTGKATSNCAYLDICVNGVVSEQIYRKRSID